MRRFACASAKLCLCLCLRSKPCAQVPGFAMVRTACRCCRCLQALNGTELEGRVVSAKLDKFVQ